jgi:uncharacterized protein with FMN-binding domain
MRARSAFFAGAGSVAILAIGWQAGVGTLVAALPSSASAATTTNTTTTTRTTGNTAATGTPAAPPAPGSGTSADGTYSGQTVRTRYGTVQVNAVIAGGKLTDVVAVKLTDNGRQSVAISTQAAPMLRQEVLSAQSSKVSNIGGATYTTQGYLTSLQSALDAAGFTG